MLKVFLINSVLIILLTSCGNNFKNLAEPMSNDPSLNTTNFGSLRWPYTKLPLVLIAPEEMRAELEVSLFNVCQSWNMAAGIPLVTYEFQNYNKEITIKNSQLDGNYKIYFQSNWSLISSAPNVLAVTMYTNYGNTISEADIAFNTMFSYFYSSFIGSEMDNFSQFDFESILVHEVGHLLGAPHIEGENNSVMKPYLANFQTNRALNDNDKKRIYDKYH